MEEELIRLQNYYESEEFQTKNKRAMDTVLAYLENLGRRYEEETGLRCIRFLEHRTKSFASICGKLERKRLEPVPSVMEERLNDLAGVRLICFTTPQIYKLARMIADDHIYEIFKTKDYINLPKRNGYQSYHIILLVPVEIGDLTHTVKVELQIRTILMDAWASVDAIVRYKKKKRTPKDIEHAIARFTKFIKHQDKIIQKVMEDYAESLREEGELH